MRKDACRAVAATQTHEDFGCFNAAGGDLLEVGGTLCVGTGEALIASAACLLVGYGKTCVIEAGQACVDAVGVFGKAGRGDDAEEVVAGAWGMAGFGLHGLGFRCVAGLSGRGNGSAGAAGLQQSGSGCGGAGTEEMAAGGLPGHMVSFGWVSDDLFGRGRLKIG